MSEFKYIKVKSLADCQYLMDKLISRYGKANVSFTQDFNKLKYMYDHNILYLAYYKDGNDIAYLLDSSNSMYHVYKAIADDLQPMVINTTKKLYKYTLN